MDTDERQAAQLPEPFNFYRLILGGDHLHFGLWPPESPHLSLEAAQDNMFRHLAAHLPDPPASVLDVGCGLGRSANLLARQGYRVTGIAPDPTLVEYARSRYDGPGVSFEAADFMVESGADFLSAAFDVLLFQESLQYLKPLDKVFRRARSLLRPKGVLVVGDEVALDRSIVGQTAVHPVGDILMAVLENGFRPTLDEKIGRQVQPTCDAIVRAFTENHERIIAAVNRDDTPGRLAHFLAGWKSQQQWYASGQMDYQILVARKDDVFIRAYRENDELAILPLFKQVFATDRTLAHWYWKFRDNPFGALKIAEAFSSDGVLAAHYCGYPVPFRSTFQGEGDFCALQIGDTMTRPDFRNLGRGPTSVLARTTHYLYHKFCAGAVPFTYGYNTANIRKFGERFLGYRYISEVHYYELAPIRRPPFAAGIVRRLLGGFSLEEVDRTTDEFDRFFERVSADYGMLVKRDARYLKWRYLDCPDRAHSLLTVKRFGQIVGWGVFRTREKCLLWGDALFDRRYPEAVAFLLGRVLHKYGAGVEKIAGWFAPRPRWWARILTRLGFSLQPEPNNLAPGFKVFDPRFSIDYLERHFYYTMGDSDLF